MTKLEQLITEQRNPKTMDLDNLSIIQKLRIMNELDKDVPMAVEKELNSIAAVIEQAADLFSKGGRIIYCGAGTSGRIGILDAVEVLPTFSVEKGRIIPLMAGGIKNYGEAGEEDEDSEELGGKDVSALNLTDKDIVIGVAASGRTPYVIGALKTANIANSITVAVSCNKKSDISKYAKYAIEVDCGPEYITGSTRLKAGTAQKLILNMISTVTMTEVGKTYSNLMVDVDSSNYKLKERWKSIIVQATGCTYDRAEILYTESNKQAKVAIAMEKLGLSYNDVICKLRDNGDNLVNIL